MTKRMRVKVNSFSLGSLGKLKQQTYDRVRLLMRNRMEFLCPFDVVESPEQDLWPYCMTAEQRQAWDVLALDYNFMGVLDLAGYFDIRNREAKYYIRVYVRTDVARWPVPWENIPPPLAHEIHQWVLRSRAYSEEKDKVCHKVKQLLTLCRTLGQVERVWPELVAFMPAHAADARLRKIKCSPYPSRVMDLATGQLVPQWCKGALEPLSLMLAEALLLPQPERTTLQIRYPDIV